MSAQYESAYTGNIIAAQIDPPGGEGEMARLSDQNHAKLLEYLKGRLEEGNVNRSVRLTRYARVDRFISTWQKLSAQDSERDRIEDNTGRSAALPMNLPILATHLEDMCAFYGEVFSSQSRDFYTVPPKVVAPAAKELATKMNRDTKARKYYKELVIGIRSLIKYNIGGYAVRWEGGGGQGELSKPGNRIESIDMYNYIYDRTVKDVSRIPWEAEFAARITVKNEMWLHRGAMNGTLDRVDKYFESSKGKYGSNSGVKQGIFYRNPPSYAGINTEGQDDRTTGQNSPDWVSYGAGLASDQQPEISGYEVVEMYCWVNAHQFGLTDVTPAANDGLDKKKRNYSLWRFTIVDCLQIVKAEPVRPVGDTRPEIPHYLGFMTTDDTREAQRSIMELMRPFQRFCSFLMNVYVAGMRKNIWGVKGIDPSMFDSSKLEQGDVAVVLNSKVPGRDVRTGLIDLNTNPGVDKAIEGLQMTMEMIQRLFPAQAMPTQIASIERAVKNQVAAVMQGVTRRLHMSCKMIDSDIMSPMRLQCYRNIAEKDPDGLSGLDEEIVAQVLGSGLNQLNREAVASEIKEIMYALIQNPESAQFYDLIGLMSYWSQLMDSPSDLGDFTKQPVTAPGAPGGAPTPGAPGASVLEASGLAGGTPAQVPAIG